MKRPNLLTQLLLAPRNRRRNAHTLQGTPEGGIAEAGFVQLGGLEQWVTVRGEDVRNPVLLFIHGGPGSPYSIFSPLLRSWERHFTLVQWDQPGTGKTFGKQGARRTGRLSFERLAEDGISLAERVSARLGGGPLVLVGSSVGSAIALHMLRRRSGLFDAYVGTDQNVGGDREHLAHRRAVEALTAKGKARGARTLERIGTDPARWTRRDFDRRNRLLIQAMTGVPNMVTDVILPAMLTSPDHGFGDLGNMSRGMDFSLEQLFEEVSQFDARALGLTFDLPFFVFQGDSDLITPTELARQYVEQIDAPHKEFALIEQAGHLAAFSRPERFLSLLLERVRPMLVGERHAHGPAQRAAAHPHP